MITISLCMIVKNEEKILKRCLDSIASLMDEIIIVDTGSTDSTRQIAESYTDKVYDFKWTGSFSDARNFSFQQASMDYIYCADADEVLNKENQERFALLKKGLLPEIDIVQMYYENQLSFNTIYSYDREYRPKLYKRLRPFVWENAIHEMVRLDPLIYESEICIEHRPTSNHKSRDLSAFLHLFKDGVRLNKRLHDLYAKELFIAGDKNDLDNAFPCFVQTMCEEHRDKDELIEACCVLARACRLSENYLEFFKYTTKAIALDGCSEICCELGNYYFTFKDFDEACVWYYNAAYETESVLDLRCHTTIPLQALSDCYEKLQKPELANEYRQRAIDSENANE